MGVQCDVRFMGESQRAHVHNLHGMRRCLFWAGVVLATLQSRQIAGHQARPTAQHPRMSQALIDYCRARNHARRAGPLSLTPRKDGFALFSPEPCYMRGHPRPAAASSPAGCDCPSSTPRGTTSEAFCLTVAYTVPQSTGKVSSQDATLRPEAGVATRAAGRGGECKARPATIPLKSQ
jgi:hypothetical protein